MPRIRFGRSWVSLRADMSFLWFFLLWMMLTLSRQSWKLRSEGKDFWNLWWTLPDISMSRMPVPQLLVTWRMTWNLTSTEYIPYIRLVTWDIFLNSTMSYMVVKKFCANCRLVCSDDSSCYYKTEPEEWIILLENYFQEWEQKASIPWSISARIDMTHSLTHDGNNGI